MSNKMATTSVRAAKIVASSMFATALIGSQTPSFKQRLQPHYAKFNGFFDASKFGRFFDATSSTSIPVSDLLCNIQDRFRVGDYYIWLYQDKDGTPTSWEKYSITDVQDGVIVIEMSTKFSAEEEYSTHHRMKVNMEEHLGSHGDRRDWRIGFEYFDKEQKWKKFGPGENVQAFEEKFDVFSMLNLTDKYKGSTRVVDFGENKLTLTRSGRHNYTEAWYAPNKHYLSGVAVLKNFAEHSFSLIKSKRGEDEVDIKVNF